MVLSKCYVLKRQNRLIGESLRIAENIDTCILEKGKKEPWEYIDSNQSTTRKHNTINEYRVL